MTFTEFKELSESIQAIFISVGVIVGGAWGLYQFFSLNTVSKAKTELEKLKRELSERGSIKIELSIKQSEAISKLVIINAKLSNTGNRDEVLNWQMSYVVMSKIIINQNGVLGFSARTFVELKSLLGEITSSTLPPHTENEFPFIVKILEPGMYLFELSLKGSEREQKTHHELITNSGLCTGTYLWSAAKYFEVA